MSKWTKKMQQFEDIVDHKYDAFAPENCLYTPSPSVNWIFANKAMGIPKGSGVLLFSEPKAGKSLLIQSAIAEMQRRDPEGEAIIFNTEMRGRFQSGNIVGVDPDRLTVFDTNRPEDIFDRLEREIVPMLQDGYPLRIVAIDSLTGIGGTKALSGDRSVNDHLVGDQALTIGKGLDKFIPIVRKHNLLAFVTAQMRANVDTSNPHGPKEKMSASWKARHSFEYFVKIRKANAADDKVDLAGNKFEDEDSKDLRGNKEITGHKIIVQMQESSIGTPGRTAMITLDYKNGIINQNEELFLMGYGAGVIKREGTADYVFGNLKIKGKANFSNKIKEDQELAKAILEEIRKLES